MQLEEFFDYKNQLMGDLLTNESIVRLLCDEGKITDDPQELVYTQVHPYEYIPDTTEHGHTFICCDVGLGELDLYSVKRFAPITDYQGKIMTFQAKDFNRPSPTGQPVPTNRKRG